jgi:hypothetical protein
MLPLRVVAFNEPFTYVRTNLDQLQRGDAFAWLMDRTTAIAGRWLAVHRPLVTGLALVGLLRAGWRWRLLTLTWVGVFAAALALTRPLVRELYLTFSPVYGLASVGVLQLARLVDRVPPTRTRPTLWLLALVVPIVAVFLQVNVDLWGDYYLPYRWFVAQ